jgi:branched-chain amino acid transport system permease protein
MLGVGRKFQAANVFDSLSVADCLRLACWKGRMPSLGRKSDELPLPDPAWLVLEATDLARHFDELAGSLSHGLRQALELAMVLALEPSVLLLDEPTAGLTKEERGKIAGVLTELRKSGELCIVLIEHDFDFVKQISSRMVVLHQGDVVLDGSVDQVANSEIVRSIYLGHAREDVP